MSQGSHVPNLKALGAPQKKCQPRTDSRPPAQPHLEFKVMGGGLQMISLTSLLVSATPIIRKKKQLKLQSL